MAIDTTALDSDADKIKAARPALLAAVQTINTLTTVTGGSNGGGVVPFDKSISYAVDSIGWAEASSAGGINVLRSLPVAEWGAIRAGTSTYNATTAVQVAITLGGRAYLEDGSFYIPGGIVGVEDGCIYGNGDKSILTSDGSVDMFSLIGTAGARKKGVRISNVKFVKTGAATTGDFINLKYVDGAVIEGVTFDGALGTNPCNLLGRATRYTRIVGCRFTGGASSFLGSSTDLVSGDWGYDNAHIDCYMAGAKQGFDHTYQHNSKYLLCTSIGSTGTFGCGFVAEFETVGSRFIGCVSYGHVRDGYYVEGNSVTGVRDIEFNGCVGYGNGEAGINLDANFKNVRIIGGSYFGNLTTFSGGTGTGAGIQSAGSSEVYVGGGVSIYDNAGPGLRLFTSAFKFRVHDANIYDNGGWGVDTTGATLTDVSISKTKITGNALGTVSSWSYLNRCTWDQGPFVSWSPTFYKGNESTTITFSLQSCVWRNSGDGFIEAQGVLVTPSSALDSATFISLPVVTSWVDNSSAAAQLRQRGIAVMDASGAQSIDGAFANDKVRIAKTAPADTTIRFSFRAEVV